MIFASATQSFPERRRSRRAFARDLAASLAIIGALGALLLVIQTKPGAPDGRALKAVSAIHKTGSTPGQQAALAPRQPRDEAAIPDAEEQRVAEALMAFALSKVSPLRPEPMTSIPASPVPLVVAPPRKPAKAQSAQRFGPPRIAAGIGQAGFTQAEWPSRVSEPKFSLPPREQPVLTAMSRFVPKPEALVNGAQSLAGGAKRTVNYSVSGLRNGAAAVQEKALALAGKLW